MSASLQSLVGRRVVVTRPQELSLSERPGATAQPYLQAKLAALGAEVIELPVIRVSMDVSRDLLADVMLEFGSYDWLVFTSANGVRYFFEEFRRIFDDIRSLGLIRIACVGEGTAQAVGALHLRVDCQPAKASAEALAEALVATGGMDSAKLLVVTGNMNRDTLVTKLEEAHAIVDCLQVYKTEKTDLSADPAAADFRARGADAVLFASSSAAESFAGQAAALALAPGAKRPLAGSIGPQTSATMKTCGIRVDFEAKTPGLDELIEALVKKLK